MAVKTAAKLRKKAAKARKRNESEKAWRQRLAVPRVLDPADCRVSWVLSGERLDDRPAPLFSPGPPPASAKSGRWVSRRYLQIGDMLMLEGDGRSGEIVSLPANLDERPRIRVGEWKKVERVFHNPPTRLMNVQLGDQVIRCTHAHRFWVEQRGWVPAVELNVGDKLLGSSGELVPVTDLFDNGEIEPVYNLRVADHHTYFVATPDRKQSVLVHNDYNGTPSWDQLIAEEQKIVNSLNAQFGTHHNGLAQFTLAERAKIEAALGLKNFDWNGAAALKQSIAALKTRDKVFGASETSLKVAAVADAAAGGLVLAQIAAEAGFVARISKLSLAELKTLLANTGSGAKGLARFLSGNAEKARALSLRLRTALRHCQRGSRGSSY